MFKLSIKTTKHVQAIDITDDINNILAGQDTKKGLCNIFVTHTTAGLGTGEADGVTEDDLMRVIQNIIPEIDFRHPHDRSHAWEHMAASLAGASLTIPFENKKLVLGTWQSVLLLEFSGPRERQIIVSF